jgi:hypothetical protein
MTTTCRSPTEGASTKTLPLFLITLTRTAKSQKIIKLSNLCHISVRMEAYRAQTGLAQCHNCQQFGHVWVNCRQPPRCLWCGGGHLHKECPKKGNSSSTPACCNCNLAEGRMPILPTTGAAATPRRSCKNGRCRGHQNLQRGVLFHPHHTRCLLRGGVPRQERESATTRSTSGDGSSQRSTTEGLCASSPA